jgi:hypothetical protein
MLATTHPDVAALVCPSLHLRWKEGEEIFFYLSIDNLLKSPLYSEAEERVTSAAMSGES